MKEYIEQFKAGDYASFGEFYKLTSKQVYFSALGVLKSPSLADEIVQETYVAFLKNVDKMDPNGNIGVYLAVIARNKSLNRIKYERRTIYDEDAVTAAKADVGGTDFEAEDLLNLLDDSLDREIVVYHVISGFRFREIAKTVGKPLGTVLWRYNRAMKLLREKADKIL